VSLTNHDKNKIAFQYKCSPCEIQGHKKEYNGECIEDSQCGSMNYHYQSKNTVNVKNLHGKRFFSNQLLFVIVVMIVVVIMIMITGFIDLFGLIGKLCIVADLLY